MMFFFASNIRACFIAAILSGTIILVSGMSLMSCSSYQSSSQVVTKQSITPDSDIPANRGKLIFEAHCIRCHLLEGNDHMNSVISNSSYINSVDKFTTLLRNPVSPMMQSFSKNDLSTEQISDLYQYIQHGQ